jgi:hypothetical protein
MMNTTNCKALIETSFKIGRGKRTNPHRKNLKSLQLTPKELTWRGKKG